MREIDRLVEEIRHLQFDDIEKMYQKCLQLKEIRWLLQHWQL